MLLEFVAIGIANSDLQAIYPFARDRYALRTEQLMTI